MRTVSSLFQNESMRTVPGDSMRTVPGDSIPCFMSLTAITGVYIL